MSSTDDKFETIRKKNSTDYQIYERFFKKNLYH